MGFFWEGLVFLSCYFAIVNHKNVGGFQIQHLLNSFLQVHDLPYKLNRSLSKSFGIRILMDSKKHNYVVKQSTTVS